LAEGSNLPTIPTGGPGELDNPAYHSWRQVSGYFDGDGNLGVEAVKNVLRLRIRFIDTWWHQVEAIRIFLHGQRMRMTRIVVERSAGRSDAYRLEISRVSSVLRSAKAMLPFCIKKAEDLRIAIDYLENRITGDEAIARLNDEVLIGRRSGNIRKVDLPLTRLEGTRTKQLENARMARAAHTVQVEPTTQNRIRSDHRELGLGIISLGRKYGYSESIIRRILRSP